MSAAAVVAGGVVACGEEMLSGFDARTGAVLWGNIPKTPYSVPIAWRHNAKPYFLVSGKLIEARTGKVLWAIPDPSESAVGESVHGEYLVMSHRDAHGKRTNRGMTCFRISPEGFKELWHHPWGYKFNTNRITTTVVHGGLAYGMVTEDGKPGVACMDLATGKLRSGFVRMRWGYAPLAAEGRVIGCHHETLHYRPTDPAAFGAKLSRPRRRRGWKDGMAISMCTSPAYADGMLYYRQPRDNGHARVVCYDLREPNRKGDGP
jgi:hypothetical protein